MLVLSRPESYWTRVTLNHESLKRLAETGKDAILDFRVYNIKNGKVDIAFHDPDYNFKIERPERKKTTQTQNA
jgi:hypothetical protein